MKNKHIKARVNELLLTLHRGFLPNDSEATDLEVLTLTVPKTSHVREVASNEKVVLSPFTYRWVAKRVKKDPSVTAYDLLKSAGFADV